MSVMLVTTTTTTTTVVPVFVDAHSGQRPEHEYDDQGIVLADRPVGLEQLQGQTLHGSFLVLNLQPKR